MGRGPGALALLLLVCCAVHSSEVLGPAPDAKTRAAGSIGVVRYAIPCSLAR